jgi:hypothetical protein
MDNSKQAIEREENYKKALESYRFLWLNSNNFSTIKAKVSMMEIIEKYERMKLKK